MKTLFTKAVHRGIMLILLFSSFTFSQTSFYKLFGEGMGNSGGSLVQTPDGGYLLLGCVNNNETILIKTDEFGDTLWTRRYPVGNVSMLYLIKALPDGNYILSYRENHLMKIDSVGNILWEKEYKNVVISSIQVIGEMNLFFSGTFFDSSKTLPYLWKVNSEGDSLWMKQYGEETRENKAWGYSLQSTYDGGAILTGRIDYDTILVIKTDGKGDTLWSKKLCIKQDPHGFIVKETKEGDYLLAGLYSYKVCETCELKKAICFLKLDKNGATLWTKKTNTYTGSLYGNSTKDGGFVFTGRVIESRESLLGLKVDANGEVVWRKTYPIDERLKTLFGNDIKETSDGGCVLTGYVIYNDIVPNEEYIVLMKVDSNGDLTAVEDNPNTPIISRFGLFTNYPNPFNPTTTINYTLPESGIVQVKIFDVLGRELKILVDEYSASGLHSVKWDGSNYSSGVYFCSIIFNGKTLNNKMLLMK